MPSTCTRTGNTCVYSAINPLVSPMTSPFGLFFLFFVRISICIVLVAFLLVVWLAFGIVFVAGKLKQEQVNYVRSSTNNFHCCLYTDRRHYSHLFDTFAVLLALFFLAVWAYLIALHIRSANFTALVRVFDRHWHWHWHWHWIWNLVR